MYIRHPGSLLNILGRSVYVLCPGVERFVITLSLLSVKFAQNYRILQNRFFVNFLNSLLKVKGHSLIVLIGNNSQLNVPILQEIKATLLMISKFQVELLSVISYFSTNFLCQFVILLYIS